MAEMDYSAAGYALTEHFEGLELTAYQDSVGVWTIGYGHTGADVQPGMAITQGDAQALLAEDVAASVAGVNAAVSVDLEQYQFDALVDFAFNLGVGALRSSTLLKLVNAGDVAGAAGEFGKWVYAGGKVLPGLVRRRAAEAAMFQDQPWQ